MKKTYLKSLYSFFVLFSLLFCGLCVAEKPVFLITPVTKTPAVMYAGQANYYTVGGNVNELNASGLVLALNKNLEELTVPPGASSFQFSKSLPQDSSYNVTIAKQPMGMTCTVMNGSGMNISSNIKSISISCSETSFTIGGSISGLNTNGLVLLNNGGDPLKPKSGDASFTFPTPVASESGYNVTVATNPKDLICTVSNGVEMYVTSNITSISIVCSPIANSYTIGGSIVGLSSNGLILLNNGDNELLVSPTYFQQPVDNSSSDDDAVANPQAISFKFPQPVAHNSSYNVTVGTNPAGLTCTVSNGAGSHVTSNINSIPVVCSPISFTVGGSIKGLTASGLVLLNNDGDFLSVAPNSRSFQFQQPVAYDSSYRVTVATQPKGMACVLSNESGSHVTSNITSIKARCSTKTFLIIPSAGVHGTISPNKLQTVLYGGSLAFTAKPHMGYGVKAWTVDGRTVQMGGTSFALSNITANHAVGVSFSNNSYTIGGTITGLGASGLVLQNNGGDTLNVASGATTFQFATPVHYGNTYSVTVLTQPANYSCTVSNGSGRVSSNVSSVSIACSAQPTLTSVTASSGSTSGGLGVTLTGTQFTGATGVTFDGVAATSVNVVNSTTITAVTPSHAAGAVDVVVETPSGNATKTNGFTYASTAAGQGAFGGTIACLTASGGTSNLISANVDLSNIKWSVSYSLTNAQSNTNGLSNTNTIISVMGVSTTYAALSCHNYTVDSAGNTPCQAGYTCYNNWFLPAKDELSCMMGNNGAAGFPHFKYSQFYWSSTEYAQLIPQYNAWNQLIGQSPTVSDKRTPIYARCVSYFTPYP
jgi:hypothetical protein